jgi:hypothetical protein
MNAIVISAIWGVVMMFSGVLSKSNAVIRGVGIAGLASIDRSECTGHERHFTF